MARSSDIQNTQNPQPTHLCNRGAAEVAVAPIEGAGGQRPQDFQNNIHFLGFIDSIFNMYMHIKFCYLLVHELTSIGGADC